MFNHETVGENVCENRLKRHDDSMCERRRVSEEEGWEKRITGTAKAVGRKSHMYALPLTRAFLHICDLLRPHAYCMSVVSHARTAFACVCDGPLTSPILIRRTGRARAADQDQQLSSVPDTLHSIKT